MKIRLSVTFDVPQDQLHKLRQLAAVADGDNAAAADFVRMDAIEYVMNYLRDNGVRGVSYRDSFGVTGRDPAGQA